MTTRDITSASRDLLIIYWAISAFCSYQLGLTLRIITTPASYSTFYLGFMAFVFIPILMASGLVLCAFPRHTPHIWRKIRIPTILIWIIITIDVWLVNDTDTTHNLVAGGFFTIAVVSYIRVLSIGTQTEQSDIYSWPDQRVIKPASQSEKPSPRDQRITSVIVWIGLSCTMPLGIMLLLRSISHTKGLPWPMLESYIMYLMIFPLVTLSFVFLAYPNNQPLFPHVKIPFICFWIMAALAMTVWMIPRIVTQVDPTNETRLYDHVTTSLSVITMGFWFWLLGTGGALRSNRTPPD